MTVQAGTTILGPFSYNVTTEVLLYRFVMGMDVVPLMSTSNDAHMMEDLSAWRVPLTEQDVETINYIFEKQIENFFFNSLH